MGVKHPVPHKSAVKKTNHKVGYHKRQKNATMNAKPSSHELFCCRCYEHNSGCPNTGSVRKDSLCKI